MNDALNKTEQMVNMRTQKQQGIMIQTKAALYKSYQ